jgi:predicted nucleic acid-binding protein
LSGAYFDAAYIAKCYFNEPDADHVRQLARFSESVTSSALCIAELACAIHRKVREGTISPASAVTIREDFLDDIGAGVWFLVPISDRILRQAEILTRTLPSTIPLRALDAIHVASAIEEGFREIWTNDRRLLAAAEHIGIKGRHIAPAG